MTLTIERTDWAMAHQARVHGSLEVPSGSHQVVSVISDSHRSTTLIDSVSGPTDHAIDFEHFAIRGASSLNVSASVVLDGTRIAFLSEKLAGAQPSIGTALIGTVLSPHIDNSAATLNLLPSGMGVVRFGIARYTAWPTTQGVWDSTQLALYDAVITDLRTRGMKAIVTCGTTPSYDRPGGGTNLSPPTNPAHHAAFVADIANRWGDVIIAIDPWNEPDLDSFWPGTDAEYVTLLRATKQAVDAVAPQVDVTLGPISLNDYPWVEGLFAVGLTGSDFGGWQPHPYPYSAKTVATGRWIDPRFTPPYPELDGSPVAGIHKIESVLASHGVTNRPMYVSEMGVSVNRVDRTNPYLRIGDADAVAMLGICIDQLRRIPNVKAICTFCGKDDAVVTDWTGGFGMLDRANNKRGFWAMMDALV